MKKTTSLRSNEAGVIHHLGLIVLVLVVVAVAGFAGFRVWQNANSNEGTETVEVNQSELDGTADNSESAPEDEISSTEADTDTAVNDIQESTE
jgi:hypothetical protein